METGVGSSGDQFVHLRGSIRISGRDVGGAFDEATGGRGIVGSDMAVLRELRDALRNVALACGAALPDAG